MTVEAIIFLIIVLSVSAISIVFPFLRARSPKHKGLDFKTQQAIDAYNTTYERIIATIRDLDEDHSIGKLDTVTYTQEREQWAQQGVQILQELDQLQGITHAPSAKQKAKTETDADVDAAIEEAIAAYRKAVTGA